MGDEKNYKNISVYIHKVLSAGCWEGKTLVTQEPMERKSKYGMKNSKRCGSGAVHLGLLE